MNRIVAQSSVIQILNKHPARVEPWTKPLWHIFVRKCIQNIYMYINTSSYPTTDWFCDFPLIFCPGFFCCLSICQVGSRIEAKVPCKKKHTQAGVIHSHGGWCVWVCKGGKDKEKCVGKAQNLQRKYHCKVGPTCVWSCISQCLNCLMPAKQAVPVKNWLHERQGQNAGKWKVDVKQTPSSENSYGYLCTLPCSILIFADLFHLQLRGKKWWIWSAAQEASVLFSLLFFEQSAVVSANVKLYVWCSTMKT